MAADNLALETVDDNLQPEAESEPNKPTEEASVTKVDDQDPPEGTDNLDAPSKSDDKSDNAEGSDASDDDENILYLELDDKEYTLDDIRKFRDGHLMQSDYTKKTTEHKQFAEKERAELKSERENLLKSQSDVSEMRDQLAVLVTEDEEIDWVELKEEDLEKYVELKEKADKRKELLAKVKSERETPTDDPALVQSEQIKLFELNPDWLDEDNVIQKQYETDTALIAEYAGRAGFSQEEFGRMTFAHHQNTLLKAAKWDQLQEKSREIKAKREKVPLVTRPKAAKTGGQPKTAGEIFFPNVK